jgi:uncharacterized protein (DUF433 family)
VHPWSPVHRAPGGTGRTLEEIQANFPFIEAADIQQATAYAAFSVRE